jgi:hypothetical protein
VERVERRFWRSRVWLQFHFEQIEDVLLFRVGVRDDVGEPRSAEAAGLGANRLEAFEDDGPGPATILAVAVGVKQRLQSPQSMPLEIVGEHADEDMGANPLVGVVVDRAQF